MFFFKYQAENEAERLFLDLILFFKKGLFEVKSKWSAAQLQYISIALNMTYNKTKLQKTLDY